MKAQTHVWFSCCCFERKPFEQYLCVAVGLSFDVSCTQKFLFFLFFQAQRSNSVESGKCWKRLAHKLLSFCHLTIWCHLALSLLLMSTFTFLEGEKRRHSFIRLICGVYYSLYLFFCLTNVLCVFWSSFVVL